MAKQYSIAVRCFLVAAGVFVIGLPLYHFLVGPHVLELLVEVTPLVMLVAAIFIFGGFWTRRRAQAALQRGNRTLADNISSISELIFGAALTLMSPFAELVPYYVQTPHVLDIGRSHGAVLVVFVGLAGIAFIVHALSKMMRGA